MLYYSRFRSFALTLTAVTGMLISVSSLLAAQNSGASEPYTHYLIPQQCVQGALRITADYWRDKRKDTVTYQPEAVTISDSARIWAAGCAARFSVDSVSSRDLWSLARLYMLLDSQDMLQTVIEKVLSPDGNPSDEEKGWSLLKLIQGALQSQPVRLSLAKELLDSMNDLDLTAAKYKVRAQTLLSGYMVTIDSLNLAQSYAQTGLSESRVMPESDRLDFAEWIVDAYLALAPPVSITKGGTEGVAVLDNAANDILTLREPGSPQAAMLNMPINRARPQFVLMGKAASPIHGDFWFNQSDEISNYPAAGRPVLLVFTGTGCPPVRCYPGYAAVKRLSKKYREAGLDIVYAISTTGSFRNQLVSDPSEEASLARKYFIDFLELPGALSVTVSTFSILPDGRRINDPGINLINYNSGKSTILIGKNGKIVWVDDLKPELERTVDRLIEEELRQ